MRTRDPMARDLRQPKYRKRVERLKNKTLPRKAKHKKEGRREAPLEF